jgi:hypothetical protein
MAASFKYLSEAEAFFYRLWLGVVVRLSCPSCKHERTLRRLPINFRCADVIGDFCGYLAKVKATERADMDALPRSLLGSAWAPQKERMDADIYFALFIVVANHNRSAHAVYYLPADLKYPPDVPGAQASLGVGEQNMSFTSCGLTCQVATGRSRQWREFAQEVVTDRGPAVMVAEIGLLLGRCHTAPGAKQDSRVAVSRAASTC